MGTTAATGKTREALVALVSELCHAERLRVRQTHMDNIKRLGWWSYTRTPHRIVEQWVDGCALRDAKEKLARVADRRKDLEEQKKTLTKARTKQAKATPAPSPSPFPAAAAAGPTSLGTGAGDDSFREPTLPASVLAARRGRKKIEDTARVLTEDEYYEQTEIIALNIIALKKEEEMLTEMIAELQKECSLHVREIKRITDEENATYHVFPHRLNDRYILVALLGKGGFSEVYKGYDLQECRYVALKLHQLTASWSVPKKENYIKHATREYEIHKGLHHDRVVELYDVFEIDSTAFCTVLEYCSGLDLDFVLKQQRQLAEKDAKSKIRQVLSALKYLNTAVTPPIIHYDLKPANVLLIDGRVKLTDFGLAKQLEHGDEMELTSQGAGTYWYLPPECFQMGSAPPRISSKVDVWSVGVIFYQCLYGERPFGHQLSQEAILQHQTILHAREVVFPDTPKVTDEAKAFIRRCLTYDVAARPDVVAVSHDPYLARPRRERGE